MIWKESSTGYESIRQILVTYKDTIKKVKISPYLPNCLTFLQKSSQTELVCVNLSSKKIFNFEIFGGSAIIDYEFISKNRVLMINSNFWYIVELNLKKERIVCISMSVYLKAMRSVMLFMPSMTLFRISNIVGITSGPGKGKYSACGVNLYKIQRGWLKFLSKISISQSRLIPLKKLFLEFHDCVGNFLSFSLLSYDRGAILWTFLYHVRSKKVISRKKGVSVLDFPKGFDRLEDGTLMGIDEQYRIFRMRV